MTQKDGQAGDGAVYLDSEASASQCLTGELCVGDADCSAGSHCNLALTPGACQKLYCGTPGTVCHETPLCELGLVCNTLYEPAQCASSAAVGTRCEGFGDLSCDPPLICAAWTGESTCAEPVAEGGGCASSSWCASGLDCNFARSQSGCGDGNGLCGTCFERLDAGDPCVHDEDCGGILSCRGELLGGDDASGSQRTCKALPGFGDACGGPDRVGCASPNVCRQIVEKDGDYYGVCDEAGGLGDDCTKLPGFASGCDEGDGLVCRVADGDTSGSCVYYLGYGDACTPDSLVELCSFDYECIQVGSNSWECSDPPVACTPSCTGKECGWDGCDGTCGTCPSGESCSAGGICQGPLCSPKCGGKACGPDSCGGTCGTCPGGAACNASGQCLASASDCSSAADAAIVASEGFAEYASSCTLGCLGQSDSCTANCLKEEAGVSLACAACVGDVANCSIKNCVAQCIADSGSQACLDCNAEYCPGGYEACSIGTCSPSCGGKECGSDGCGGTCGSCTSGTCQSGQCVPEPTSDCGDIVYEGCCEGKELKYCEGGELLTIACPDSCGWKVSAGFYDCGESGSDPSGQFPKDCTPSDCEPFCVAGWECGSDGCGGTCGSCTGGELCDSVTRKCEPPPAALKQFGEACGPTSSCTEQSATYPSCLHAQCDEGYCLDGACTINCVIKKDAIDAFGAANPDGIEDPGAVGSNCAAPATGGPYGQTWRCIQNTYPGEPPSLSTCRAGTTFKPCSDNSDCPTKESCQLVMLNGQQQKRCAVAATGAVNVGQYCNEDPESGALIGCKSGLCLNGGSCSSFCDDDTDCGGTFMTCAQDVPLSSTIEVDICLGKSCNSNLDCPGDSACTLGGNGQSGAAFAFANKCEAMPAGAVGVGEMCDGDLFDDVPGPACKGLCLGNDVCSTLCTANSDCNGSAIPMICNVNEATYDFDDDGIEEEIDAYGVCAGIDGSKATCFDSSDCSNGEACEFYQTWTGISSYDGVGYCSKPATEGAGVGELCGGDTGIVCKSGFCMPTFDSGMGICTSLCSSTDDCTQGITPPGAGVVLNQLCQTLLFSNGGTFDQIEDNVYVPICVATENSNSLEDCSGDYVCSQSEEGCSAVVHAFGASGPAGVEYRCIDAVDESGDPNAKKLGELCSTNTDPPLAATSCEDIYCNPDVKAGQGYCTKPCNTTADCAGGTPDMVCDSQTLRERAPGDDVTAKFCLKAKSCIPCDVDDDCTDGFVCGNIASGSLNPNMRCMPSCATSADCAGKDGGPICKAVKLANGTTSTKTACAMTSCL